jgi:hypothetical protein
MAAVSPQRSYWALPALLSAPAYRAAHETLVPAEISKALVNGHGEDTERTRVLDVASRSGWPPEYTARVVTNAFLDDWRGREHELAADTATQQAYREAADRNDLDFVSIWAGEALDLITQLASPPRSSSNSQQTPRAPSRGSAPAASDATTDKQPAVQRVGQL